MNAWRLQIPDAANSVSGPSLSPAIFALAVVALGGYVVFEAVTGLDDPGYATIGPGAFPVMVGVALTLAGTGLLIEGWRGRWRVVWVERDTTAALSRASGNSLGRGHGLAWVAGVPVVRTLLVAAALALNVILFAPVGFVLASATMFALVAAAFGSGRHVPDAALGLLLGGTIYFVFVYGLGLPLPAGALWGSWPWMR